MAREKILIGTPTYSGKFYCLSEWADRVQRIASVADAEVLVVDNSADKEYADRITQLGLAAHHESPAQTPQATLLSSRRRIFDHAVTQGYDYLLMLEQDLFPPENVIERLLAHRQPIVGGLYLLGQLTNPEYRRKIGWVSSCAEAKRDIQLPGGQHAMYWLTLDEVKGRGLLPVRSCGFGCTLIQTNVLKKVSPRIEPGLNRYDDYYFFMDCESNDIPIFTDTDTFIEHYPSLGGGSGWMELELRAEKSNPSPS